MSSLLSVSETAWEFHPVDPSSGVPIHRQVYGGILAAIERAGDGAGRLPTERELCTAFGVSRFTLRQAVSDLVRVGLLYRIQGNGTFVRGPAMTERVSLRGYLDPWLSSSLGERLRIDEMTMLPAPPDVAQWLGWSEPGQVLYLRRSRNLDGRPLAIDHRYLVRSVGERLTSAQAARSSLSDFMVNVLGLDVGPGEMEIYLDQADDEDAIRLGLGGARQVLVRRMELRSRAGEPLMVGRSVYRPDLARLRFTVPR